MEVFTFCPPSGFGDIIVTIPFEAIFKKPFNSTHSSTIAIILSGLDANDDIQLKLINIPPPASAEDLRNDRLLMEVVFVDTTFIYILQFSILMGYIFKYESN